MFLKYFNEQIEFPQDKLVDFLPWNNLWEYVDVDLLNGLINHCKIIKSFCISRYNSWNSDCTIKIMNPPDGRNWEDFNGTKLECYNKITEKGRTFHTNIFSLQDDVLILGNIKENRYIFFWYDLDVSDCCVGRFETKDPEKVVIDNFCEYCKERGLNLSKDYLEHEENVKELPIHFFRGWLSSR